MPAGIKLVMEPVYGASDQTGAPARNLFAKPGQHESCHSLGALEQHVAGKTVANHNINAAVENLVGLDKALIVLFAVAFDQSSRLANQVRSLIGIACVF